MGAGTPELAFELPGGGHVLFTTRAHGNLSSCVGDDSENGGAARARVRARSPLSELVTARQVHGTVVRRVGVGDLDPGGAQRAPASAPADGLVTAIGGVGVMVLVADCLPVALGMRGAVAIVHAGWRGLAGGMLEQGVQALRETAGGAHAQEIVAVIGPCAGACCYETGEEVHAAFGQRHRHGRRLDLRAHARERLAATGVSRVEQVELCTICDTRLFSHRREGARAGRQAGVAWRN